MEYEFVQRYDEYAYLVSCYDSLGEELDVVIIAKSVEEAITISKAEAPTYTIYAVKYLAASVLRWSIPQVSTKSQPQNTPKST